MVDSHCHLQFRAFDNNREEIIKHCLQKQMLLNIVGTQTDTSRLAVELAEKYENFYATIGLHPVHLHATEIDEEESAFLSRTEEFNDDFYDELAKSKKVIAVGECGLELFHLPKNLNREEILRTQKEFFLKQWRFAKKHNLPLVLHVRDAHKEMQDVFDEIGGVKGVMHCYTSNWENAENYLAHGLYLGFTGVITFPAKKTDPKTQEDLIEVVKKCPLDRILIETDAPYLAPQVYRGKQCEPWMVYEVAKKIAEIKNLGLEEVEKITTDNFKRLFCLNKA